MEDVKRGDMLRCVLLPDLFRKLEYAEGRPEWEKITVEEFFNLCSPEELKHFRAVINGKIGKRKITPEQQTTMQAARKRKVI